MKTWEFGMVVSSLLLYLSWRFFHCSKVGDLHLCKTTKKQERYDHIKISRFHNKLTAPSECWLTQPPKTLGPKMLQRMWDLWEVPSLVKAGAIIPQVVGGGVQKWMKHGSIRNWTPHRGRFRPRTTPLDWQGSLTVGLPASTRIYPCGLPACASCCPLNDLQELVWMQFCKAASNMAGFLWNLHLWILLGLDKW